MAPGKTHAMHSISWVFFLITDIGLVSLFYLNYYVLFNYFFKRRRLRLYSVVLIAVTFVFCIGQNLARIWFTPAMDGLGHKNILHLGPGLLLFFLISVLSSGLRITDEWFKSEQRNKAIETDKLKVELTSLKTQINPHFLFNALNTIYSLTITGSATASEGVLKLSKMMRYVMEDSQDNMVDLAAEIEHLENYIEFQQLRSSDKLILDYKKSIDTIEYKIAPLVLIPFVENAFKYGLSNHSDSPIKIDLEVKAGVLGLKVTNKIFMTSTLSGATSGIGIQNTKRRLDLLYPNRYGVNIMERSGIYMVELIINLV